MEATAVVKKLKNINSTVEKETCEKTDGSERNTHVLKDSSFETTVFLTFLIRHFSLLYNYKIFSVCLIFFINAILI